MQLLAMIACLFCMFGALIEITQGHALHTAAWIVGVLICFWAIDLIGDPE